jgi:predicted house-cleaning noncanonical NTP pyrophosphatase (MazG superfamily)
VRDKIPQIIREKCSKLETHTASESEYWEKLKEKLIEEVEEFIEGGDKEEFIDIIEVPEAIKSFKGFDEKELDGLRNQKVEERGAFAKKIILDKVS